MSDVITLYGNQIIDYLIASDYVPTQQERENLKKPKIIPDWNTITNTIINCQFTSNLVSTYVSGMTSPITGFEVYKSKEFSNIFEKIATVDRNTTSIIDYLVSNNTKYSWVVFPTTENELGISMQSDFERFCWWDWTLIGLDEVSPNSNLFFANEVFKFSLNVQSEPETQNRDITIMPGISQYPKFSVGANNYLSGGITAMLGHIKLTKDGKDYIEPSEVKTQWYDFIAQGKPCLLKDRSGHMRKVMIDNSSTTKVMDALMKQPNSISFKWIERGTMENMSVYEVPPQELYSL